VPVGVPPPDVTTAVNVTDWLHTLGFFELVRLVVVATAWAAPTLPSKVKHAENKILFMRFPPIFGTVRLICIMRPSSYSLTYMPDNLRAQHVVLCAQSSRLRAIFLECLGDRLKGGRIISVQRTPTASLLPVIARTEIRHFRSSGQLLTKYMTRRAGGSQNLKWPETSP